MITGIFLKFLYDNITSIIINTSITMITSTIKTMKI